MRKDLTCQITTIACQLFRRERFWPADKFAGDSAAWPAFSESILHGLYLHVVPVRPEGAKNAAVMRHIAVPVGGAFPDTHCRKVWRLKRCHVPLIDRVIGNAIETDFAVAPRLPSRPFDALVKIPGFAR